MDLSSFYPPRDPENRKGDHGRVLVVGGSDRYAGALAFNALAAMRAGADLAIVLAPRRAADLVASYAPDLITVPCEDPYPDPDFAEELLEDAHALVIGGGVERSTAAHAALRAIMDVADVPIIADAEALHALEGMMDFLTGKDALLTPHGGEFQVLTGEAWPKDTAAREAAAKEAADTFGASFLVKGAEHVVSDGERVTSARVGSPYLTKGGYGDLTAGAVGALAARGHDLFDAARAGAYLVGRAGELASADLGESTFASDALARFPDVLPRSTK